LNPGGYLVLGMFESLVGVAMNAFEHINNKFRIYRKPEANGLKFFRKDILSQDEVDEIVGRIIK